MFLYLLMCNYDLAIIMCINFTVNILIKAQSKNNFIIIIIIIMSFTA